MQKKISSTAKIKYYNKWISEIAKNTTEISIKRHIVRHAKEIYEKDLQGWSASMMNLVEIFDAKRKMKKPAVALKLGRLAKKYKENTKKYTPPPKI